MARHWILGASASAVLHGGAVAMLLASVHAPGGAPAPETAQSVIELELISTLRSSPDLTDPSPVAANGPGEAVSPSTPEPSLSGRTDSTAASASSEAASKGGSPSAAPDARLVSDYYRRLEGHLARYHAYPGGLRGERPTGTVQIGLIVRRDGRVMDAWVQRSSGAAGLDEAALATVRRAEPLPALPSDLPGAIDLVVPLNYETRSVAG